MAKRISKVDVKLETVSGSITHRDKETFYTYCGLAGVKPANVITDLIKQWIADFELDYFSMKTAPVKTKNPSSEAQLSYIEGLSEQLGISFNRKDYPDYASANNRIRELLDVKNNSDNNEV